MAPKARERLKVVQISGKNVDINIMRERITKSENMNNHQRRSSQQQLQRSRSARFIIDTSHRADFISSATHTTQSLTLMRLATRLRRRRIQASPFPSPARCFPLQTASDGPPLTELLQLVPGAGSPSVRPTTLGSTRIQRPVGVREHELADRLRLLQCAAQSEDKAAEQQRKNAGATSSPRGGRTRRSA